MAPAKQSGLTSRTTDLAAGLFPSTTRPVASKPSDLELSFAICRETGCTHDQAEALVDLVHRADQGTNSKGVYRLTDTDMLQHHLFSQVFPGKQPSRPGSAHALTEKALGRTFRHIKVGRDQCAAALGFG